jgi:hypothetical protein
MPAGRERPDTAARPTAFRRTARQSWLQRAVLLAVLIVLAPTAFRNLGNWLWRYLAGSSLRTDFTLYWIFSRTGLDHGWDRLYDLDAERATYSAVGKLQFFPLPYTPPMAWFTVPFAQVDPQRGYLLWSVLIAGCLLVAWWLTTPERILVKLVLLTAALGVDATYLGLVNGQIIAVQMAAVAVAYRLLRRDRQVAAGLVLVLIALRPQTLMLVPAALLLVGKRRTFLTWSAGSGLLVVGSLVSLGRSGTLAYLERIQLTQSNPKLFWVFWYVSPSWVLRRNGYGWLIAPATVLLLGVVAVVAWRSRPRRSTSTPGDLEVPLAAAIIGSLLVAPFLHLQDLAVLFLAGWLLLRARRPGLAGSARPARRVLGAAPRDGGRGGGSPGLLDAGPRAGLAAVADHAATAGNAGGGRERVDPAGTSRAAAGHRFRTPGVSRVDSAGRVRACVRSAAAPTAS